MSVEVTDYNKRLENMRGTITKLHQDMEELADEMDTLDDDEIEELDIRDNIDGLRDLSAEIDALDVKCLEVIDDGDE